MAAVALSSTNPHQEIPDALIPQVASVVFANVLTTSQAADYLQNELGIPFGRRKLCAARNGHCDGPPVFIAWGQDVLYLKSQLKEWARWEHPSKMLIDPWRDRDED